MASSVSVLCLPLFVLWAGVQTRCQQNKASCGAHSGLPIAVYETKYLKERKSPAHATVAFCRVSALIDFFVETHQALAILSCVSVLNNFLLRRIRSMISHLLPGIIFLLLK
jgi:hypothetical protein